jgi:hypothetical protein
MDRPVDTLYAEAERKAAENPPGRVLATVILAIFTAIGWFLGKIWTGIWFCCIAFTYGWRKGASIPIAAKTAPATP